jgi:ribonuclease HII
MQIFGMDEVGRGCLAGPMIACRVPQTSLDLLSLELKDKIKDSKKTTPNLRAQFAHYFHKHNLPFKLSCITAEELNGYGLAWAQYEIFERLVIPGGLHYIDGKFKLSSSYRQYTVNLIHADSFHPLVGLASILAKFYRDEYMSQIDQKYPEYSFGKHKGYGTLFHREAIRHYGITPEHRLTFIKKLL